MGLAFRQAFDERRLFVLIPFAMIAGLVASLLPPGMPDPALLLGVGALLLVAIALSGRALVALRTATLLAACWVGFSLLSLHATLFGTGMLSRPVYGSYEMRVDEVLTREASGTRVIVSNITPVGRARTVPVRRARLVLRGAPELAPGNIVGAPIRFYPVPAPVVPNGFDTQFHAFFDGIGAYGNSTGTVSRISVGEGAPFERAIDDVRRGIAERIDGVLAQPAAGIARALITGDQSAVTEAARKTMATAGLAHVLSVSGLHLSMVAALVMGGLRIGLAPSGWLHRRLSAKRLAAAGAIVASLGYFAISGGNVAALRSTIMLVLVLGAVLVGRRALTMRNVAIAAIIIVLINPASVLRPSFQLSFAAVVALIGAWEIMRPPGQQKSIPGRIAGYFIGIGLTSVIAGLATLLFSIYHFQQTSPLGLLGNLFSLPLVGFVMMPAAVLAALAMPVGVEGPFLFAMGWSIDRMLDLAGLVAAWSTGLTASPLLTPVALVLGLAALAWFAFLRTWHRYIGPVLLVPAVVFLALDGPPDVLIADTTQAVAMRGVEGLGLVAGKAGSFAVEVWSQTYAESIEPAKLLQCDSLGCYGTSPRGFSLAIARDVAAFYEDCGVADLVIIRRPAPVGCAAARVVDANDLARYGSHWLRWDEGEGRFEVRPAISMLDRPWRAQPGR